MTDIFFMTTLVIGWAPAQRFGINWGVSEVHVPQENG